jgi:hypothetical protein
MGGIMKREQPLTIGDLINEQEIEQLRKFLKKRKNGTCHNAIMAFIDTQPQIMDKFAKEGVIKPYGAYLLEFYLELE